jgi:hypothetical protein
LQNDQRQTYTPLRQLVNLKANTCPYPPPIPS